MLVTSRKVQTLEFRGSKEHVMQVQGERGGSAWVWQQESESLLGSLEDIREGVETSLGK